MKPNTTTQRAHGAQQPSDQLEHSSKRVRRRGLGLQHGALSLALGLTLGACGSGSGGSASAPPSNVPTDNGMGSFFLPQSNFGGQSGNLSIVNMEWGRLIDVFETTGDPQNPIGLVFADLLADRSIIESTLDYTLTSNPVSGKEFVIVNYDRNSPEFTAVITELTDTQPVQPKGLIGNELPPFTAVSRNSVLAINFNDLIDPATITPENLILVTGDEQPDKPFEARIVGATTHGAMLNGTFYTTRVLVDFTVSALEAKNDPSLKINAIGLPSAQQVNKANAALRIPTKAASGQFTLLTNLSAHPLNFASAGPVDPFSTTLDVVRSFRSQGRTELTGDPNNGFLPDGIKPSILGTQAIFATPAANDLTLFDVAFYNLPCVMPLRVGDILEFTGFTYQVVIPGQLAGSTVVNVRVVPLEGNPDIFGPSAGLLRTTWSPGLGAPPECFVRFDPQPGIQPATDVPTITTIIAEFSEPMDPATVQALNSFQVSYDNPPMGGNPIYANVIGRIVPAADLKGFTFAPSLPLRHTDGTAEVFHIDIKANDPQTSIIEGVTDLAGNPLSFDLPQTAFSVVAADPTRNTAGIGLSFNDAFGDEDGDGRPDMRGQYVVDPRGVIKPRTFQRFSTAIDDSQPIIANMTVTGGSIQTPLSDKGSKAQLIWRYIDMGFGLLNDDFHNLDVEGTNWAPFDTSVQQDKFTNFSIALAHCFYLPDEAIDAGLLPMFKASGVTQTYDSNLLDPGTVQIPGTDPLTVVSNKEEPIYQIKASDAFNQAQTNTLLVPWPINRDVQLKDYKYWTWRDTAKIKVGGSVIGIGADPAIVQQVLGLGSLEGFYPKQNIPTIALPLLSEYRTHPDIGAFALNGFKTSFAINSSYRPTFRAFSTGGVDTQGDVNLIDPDNEPLAQGGYNPNPLPPALPGTKTGGVDNTVYWGQADFVVRVSRMHTVWFDTGAKSNFAPEVVEPEPTLQPTNTTITMAFRGASAMTTAGGAPPEWADANRIDPYGDAYTQVQLDKLSGTTGLTKPFTATYFPISVGKNWSKTPGLLNGARYLQMRVTFTANAESGLIPELAGVGVAYSNQ